MNKVLFESEGTNWETPQELFDKLDDIFHFDIDVCASRENTKCPSLYITKESNCLTMNWTDFINYKIVCFMNPPYGRKIGLFIKKAYEESLKGCKVVCLLPARTDTKWWHDNVIKASDIWFLKGRLKFSGNSAPFPSVIVIFDNKREGLITKYLEFNNISNEVSSFS